VACLKGLRNGLVEFGTDGLELVIKVNKLHHCLYRLHQHIFKFFVILGF
jgi:hypothetical protein